MPTSRAIPFFLMADNGGLSVLVGIAERDVPASGVLVEGLPYLHRIELGYELHRRLDGVVAGFLQMAAKGLVHGERPDLVRVRRARFAIDPPQQCQNARG